MSNQSEAVRLADALEYPLSLPSETELCDAATELRRLHEVETLYLAAMRGRHAMSDEVLRMNEALTEIYEVWAGSEGIPEPQTACEAYLLRLIEQMRDIARAAIKAAEENT